MKNLFALFIISLLLANCAKSITDEDRAQSLITQYMQENLKYPSSYEPTPIKLDSMFNPYAFTKEGEELRGLMGAGGEYSKKAHELRRKGIVEGVSYSDSVAFYENLSEEAERLYKKNEREYKGEFIGWRVIHKYRAKNGYGAMDVFEKSFLFDEEITTVVAP